MTNEDPAAGSAPRLGDLVRRRIKSAYGGNQRAFAAATGLMPQYVNRLAKGDIELPATRERRLTLARELGVSHLQLFVLAGELTEEEASAGGSPTAAGSTEAELAVLAAELTPGELAAVRAVVLEFVAQRRRSEAAEADGPAAARA